MAVRVNVLQLLLYVSSSTSNRYKIYYTMCLAPPLSKLWGHPCHRVLASCPWPFVQAYAVYIVRYFKFLCSQIIILYVQVYARRDWGSFTLANWLEVCRRNYTLPISAQPRQTYMCCWILVLMHSTKMAFIGYFECDGSSLVPRPD